MKFASGKKWITVSAAVLLVCVCAAASAQTYRLGDEADEIATIQTALKQLKLYTGEITGHYGSKTEAAVKAFQKKYALEDDGIAGDETIKELYKAADISGSSSSSSSSSSSDSSALRHGSRSEGVRQMQEDLKKLGYYSGTVSGHYGTLTEAAVTNFQKDNGLSADGIAGSKTLAKIASALSSKGSGSSSSFSSSSSGSSKLNTAVTLQLSSNSTDVKKLQQRLDELGFYTGNITGNFGEKTRDAVIAFQKAAGLTADGIAGKRTLEAINAKVATASSSSVSTDKKAGNVLYANFYNWRKNYANGQYCTVYDFKTGYSWTLRILSKDAHMDAEPLTAEDTAIMNKAFGGKTTWTPKAVWVTFSDGKTYLGTTHNTPHDTYTIKNNNFDGHVCVHFPIAMEKANEIGPYATSHQEAINDGWEETKKLKY